MATLKQLAQQWKNPSDVTAILMIIGGDVVRTALAQSAGTLFTPVCFSFGWVAYTFMALIGVLGDGRLMPVPDVHVKVFDLNTGYSRENRNWVIGRIARDHASLINRIEPCEEGMRIAIYEAGRNTNGPTRFSYDKTHLYGLLCIALQFLVSALPLILDDDWSVMLIISAGTILALVYGALPQWTAEKLPSRQDSNITFAIITGNGSHDVMIVKGMGRCLNLADFSTPDTPRSSRLWEKFRKPDKSASLDEEQRISFGARWSSGLHRSIRSRPVGFLITVLVTTLQSVAWLVLMITTGAIQENTWYLLLVGAIGMLQNGLLAALERPPESRNLPLKYQQSIIRFKVMDALMDVQALFDADCDRDKEVKIMTLVKEFFPGDLRDDESAWWNGDRQGYDAKRILDCEKRGQPALPLRKPQST